MKHNNKIADHSSLQISTAINRLRHLKFIIPNLHPAQLLESLQQIHTIIFQDFILPGKIKAPHKTTNCLEILSHCLIESDKDVDKIADAIAVFILHINEIAPFAFGNHIASRVFVYFLSHTLVKYGFLRNHIDFRHMQTDGLIRKNHPILSDAVTEDITKQYHPPLDDKIEEWPILPSSSIEISGYKYMCYKNKYLVTLNGGLIEIDTAMISLDKFVKYSDNPGEFMVERDAISSYLFNRNKPLSTLDGMTFGDQVPLFCLDIDYLTGLHIGEELQELHYKLQKANISVLDIPESSGVSTLIDDYMRNRVAKLRSFINIAKRRFFENAQPVEDKPMFFLSMGGIGSGKSHLEKYISNFTDGNHVMASVDLARASSKLFDFYTKCTHHTDDYQSLKLFSYALVGEISKEAILGNYNYFRDSSGIPYSGRDQNMVEIFKRCGYETMVFSASAPLFVEKDRKDLDAPVHKRIMKRYRKKKRSVPWDIVVKKHVEHPKAFLDALRHEHLDHIYLYDTMGKKGETKLLAVNVDLTSSMLKTIRDAFNISKGFGFQTMIDNNLIDLSILPKQFKLHLMEIVECHAYNEDLHRILVVLDMQRYIDFLQKGMLFDKARGYEELVFNSHPYHIPSIDYPYDKRNNEKPYRLRNQCIGNESYKL